MSLHVMTALSARRHDGLLPPQSHLANQAIDLLESLAGVGLHALVQEAVGWHRGDLHHLFERYLLEIPSKYRQFFEDDYWRGAFALHGKKLDPTHKHPAWVKGFVYRSVYRYVPEVLHGEVSQRNPVIDLAWRRRSKQFQYYSDDGKLKLHDQIIRVMCAGNKVQWRYTTATLLEYRVAVSPYDRRHKYATMIIAYPKTTKVSPMTMRVFKCSPYSH